MADRGEPFRPLVGLPGKLYLPRPGKRCKHPCPDCFSCQWCGDSRCSACRATPEEETGEKPKAKGSLARDLADQE